MNSEKIIFDDSKFFDNEDADLSDSEHNSPAIKFPNATHQFRNVLASNKGKVRSNFHKWSITKRDTFYDSKLAISFLDKSFAPKYADFSNARSSWILWDKFEWKGIWIIDNSESKNKVKAEEDCIDCKKPKKNRKFSEFHHDAKQSSFFILSKLQEGG